MHTPAPTNVSMRELRSFGITVGVIFVVLFGLGLPWLRDRPLPLWPFAVGTVLAAFGTVAPALLRPIYRVWMKFGAIMARITTPIILGLLFFVVVTPIARIRAARRRDPLARRRDPTAPSYRTHSQARTAQDLERPF